MYSWSLEGFDIDEDLERWCSLIHCSYFIFKKLNSEVDRLIFDVNY